VKTPRRSIARPALVRGMGLHTGVEAEARFLPAPAGSGIVFRRADLAGAPEIPARLSEVSAVDRRTALGPEGRTSRRRRHFAYAL